MENQPKRRGRKKLSEITVESENVKHEISTEKKKRGRKKKWESTVFKTNILETADESIIFDKKELDTNENYKTENFTFGNLCIKVHDKEVQDDNFILNSTNKNCDIIISSDEEDTCELKKRVTTKKIVSDTKCIENTRKLRCYNCHHVFEGKSFFLPINYCDKLDRFKLYGNFCSPNCVKSFCLNSKNFGSKIHLIGQFYRKLFGAEFRINPAPSIYNLIEYGGEMTIEQFRNSSYKNDKYIMSSISSKVIYI